MNKKNVSSHLCGAGVVLLMLSLLACESQYVCIGDPDNPTSCGRTAKPSNNPDLDKGPGVLNLQIINTYKFDIENAKCSDGKISEKKLFNDVFENPLGLLFACKEATICHCEIPATSEQGPRQPINTTLIVAVKLGNDPSEWNAFNVCIANQSSDPCTQFDKRDTIKENNPVVYKYSKSHPAGLGDLILNITLPENKYISIKNIELLKDY